MEEQIETLQVTPAQEAEPEAPKKTKRTTLASLKADFTSLESFMDEEVIPAIELIEDRVNKIIEKGVQTRIVEPPMLEARLQALEAGSLSDRADVAADIADRLNALEAAEKITSGNQSTLLKTHIQMQDDLNVINSSINTIHDAVVEMQEEETADAPTPHLMADFVEEETTRTEHIANLANVCVSMSDVLLICRYLKADPEIPEEIRIETLQLACRRAGVPVSAGMSARAGVKYVVA